MDVDGDGRGRAESARVQLPGEVTPPFEVYVNGVFQHPDRDFRRNDSVDVVYWSGGRRVVATGLPFEPAQ